MIDDNGLLHEVKVHKGSETDAGTLMLWRVMAKMQFEFTNESDRDIKILGIDLRGLLSVHRTGIGDRYGHIKLVSLLGDSLVYLTLPDRESSIAQAIAELVERNTTEISVGTALHIVVQEIRQLVGRSIERHRKTAGRIVIAEKDIGKSLGAALARIPSLEKGIVAALHAGESDT